MSYSIGRRCSSSVGLWHGPVAVALIGLLAWELPYAAGVAIKKRRKKEKKKWKKKKIGLKGLLCFVKERHFPPEPVGCHWRILGREVACSFLCLERILCKLCEGRITRQEPEGQLGGKMMLMLLKHSHFSLTMYRRFQKCELSYREARPM